MSSNIKMEILKAEIAPELETDFVGLWVIAKAVGRTLAQSSFDSVRRATLKLIHEMLTSEMMVAGDFTPERIFSVWKGSPEEIVTRIDQGWRAIGRMPTLGEVVWFTARDERH